MSGVDEGPALNPWDVLMVWWTARRVGSRIGGGDWWRSPLNRAGDDFCRDDLLRFFLALLGRMDARQCISLYISWTGEKNSARLA